MKKWQSWHEQFQADRQERMREAFKKGFSQTEKTDDIEEDEKPEIKKESIDAKSPWATLMKHAVVSKSVPILAAKGNKHNGSLGDPLLDLAVSKAVKSLRQSTGLDDSTIKRELLSRFTEDIIAQKSAISTVRFMRGADSAWFTECEVCGHDNDPPWEVCSNCEKTREEPEITECDICGHENDPPWEVCSNCGKPSKH